MERQLQRLNWLQVRELVPKQIDTVLIAVGTVEAHGSACLGTDNIIPETINEGIAERLNALIAPTVNYGITKSLLRYNGGSMITPSVLQAYVRDILDAFADAGFRNIIVMNGHGGNNSALKATAFDFHAQRKVNVAVVHWWELCADLCNEFYGHAGGHAGTDEAAMVQAVDPALFDQSRYDPDLAYYFRPGADIYPIPGTILLYKEGEGYPEYDPERSKEYREKVVQTVGDFVEMIVSRWRKFDL